MRPTICTRSRSTNSDGQLVQPISDPIPLELWEQETGMVAVLMEGFSELSGQHGFFFFCLDGVAKDD